MNMVKNVLAVTIMMKNIIMPMSTIIMNMVKRVPADIITKKGIIMHTSIITIMNMEKAAAVGIIMPMKYL